MPTSAESFYGRLQGIVGQGNSATEWEAARNARKKAQADAIKNLQDSYQQQIQFQVTRPPDQQYQSQGTGTGIDNSTGDALSKFGIFPVNNYRLSSKYGGRTHPVTGKHSNHTGLDFATGKGSPIYAVSDGTVRSSLFNKIYGNQTILDFGGGVSSMYGHQSKSIVKPGQRVKKGQVIGYVGSTGLSTGPHLHFETWVNNKPVNPMSWFIWNR